MKELKLNLKKSWPYIKDHKRKLIIYALLNIISIGISLVLPMLGATMIVKLTSNKLNQVFLMALIIFIIQMINNFMNYLSNSYEILIYREAFKKLQLKLGSETLKIENKILDNTSSGVFISRLTDDTSKIADIFYVLYDNITRIITDLGIFVAIFIISKRVFFYILTGIILMALLNKKKFSIRNEKDKEYRKKNELLYGFIGELVRGTKDIKMLNAENSFIKELNNKIVDTNNKKYEMNRVNRNYNLLIGSMEDAIYFVLIVIILYEVSKSRITLPLAIVVHSYSNRLPSLNYFLSNLQSQLKSFNLSANRVFSIIDSDEFKKEAFGKRKLKKANGDFEFDKVKFGYNDKLVLNDMSFKINANETVAFVGKSGAGKTTIFNLLCKMYDNYEGDITLDGINIRDLDKDSIRGNITIISQSPYIFNMSIKDNLRLVKQNITLKEIKEACKLACLDDFIENLPDKYDTIVGEGGVNLSGGQKQRLAIARAFIQKTEIILFDEATSALDNETQLKIKKAIDNLKKDYTIMIIAHRLSTIINSDRILYLEDGHIIASGSHEELIKNCSSYRDLYNAELNKM